MRLKITPFFYLSLLLSAFATPINTVNPPAATRILSADATSPTDTHATEEPLESSVVTEESVVVTDESFVVELILWRWKSKSGEVSVETVNNLRNSAEILLPWLVPLLHYHNNWEQEVPRSLERPAKHMSFHVANLTQRDTGRIPAWYTTEEEEYWVEAKFSGNTDSIHWDLLINFDKVVFDKSPTPLKPEDAIKLQGFAATEDGSHDRLMKFARFEAGKLWWMNGFNNEDFGKFSLQDFKWQQNEVGIKKSRNRIWHRNNVFLFQEPTPPKKGWKQRVKEKFSRLNGTRGTRSSA
ncbi:hypothetical protein EV360DRAFT_88901 [Lentinula raphanica]|nr:hypothetical protein EV360DRAFT_88901 [Lentinula raphanica]